MCGKVYAIFLLPLIFLQLFVPFEFYRYTVKKAVSHETHDEVTEQQT